MNEHGIEELIGTLYEMVQDARSVPFSSDKCAVERENLPSTCSTRSATSSPAS